MPELVRESTVCSVFLLHPDTDLLRHARAGQRHVRTIGGLQAQRVRPGSQIQRGFHLALAVVQVGIVLGDCLACRCALAVHRNVQVTGAGLDRDQPAASRRASALADQYAQLPGWVGGLFPGFPCPQPGTGQGSQSLRFGRQ